MFNNNSDLVNQQQKSNNQVYTGLTQVKILGINPTLSQLSDILGSEEIASKFDTNYQPSDFNGVETTPIVLWLQDLEEKISPTPVQIGIGKDIVISKNQSEQFINDYFQNSYSQNMDTLMNNSKMSWFSKTGLRNARIGEVRYYDFLIKVLKMKVSEGNALAALKEEKLDFDTILNGDFSGLRNLVGYLPSIEGFPITLATVKEVEDDTGKTRLRQKFAFYEKCIFRPDEIGTFHTNKIMELHLDGEETGYPFSKNYYTIDFQPYNKETCLNYKPAPSDTMSPADFPSSSDEPSWMRH